MSILLKQSKSKACRVLSRLNTPNGLPRSGCLSVLNVILERSFGNTVSYDKFPVVEAGGETGYLVTEKYGKVRMILSNNS